MATERKVWTREEVLALRDEQDKRWYGPFYRYELIDGDLLIDGQLWTGEEPPVTPSPGVAHQLVARLLFKRIDAYVESLRLGVTLWSPADLTLDSRGTVQPDLFVIPAGERITKWTQVSALLLAVEILSPSTAHSDRVRKRSIYQESGVGEYWVVDTDARVVDRWRPADERPEVVADVLRWQPADAHPPLEIDLVALFREALGD